MKRKKEEINEVKKKAIRLAEAICSMDVEQEITLKFTSDEIILRRIK